MNQSLKDQLAHIPKGKYLMIYGHWGNAINHTIEQGELLEVDFEKDTVVLHNTVYDNNITVDMTKAFSIDESRSGSGALGSVLEPDWKMNHKGEWFKGERKYEGS